MKAFEEWRLKNCEDNCDIGVDSGPCHQCSGLGTKEDAWKAALKQVLAKIDFWKSDAKNITAVFSFIKEELEQ